MCEPVSAALAVAAVAGGVAKSVGDYQQGQAVKRQDYANAGIEESAAADSRLRGQTAAGQVRMHANSSINQEKAQVGASGIALAGSPMDVLSDKRWLSELDAQTVTASAGREAAGHSAQAGNMRTAGNNAEAAGEIGAVTDLIGAAGQALQFGSKGGWFTGAPPPVGGGVTLTEDYVQPAGNWTGPR
jgi:hypothetical protein